MFNNINVCNNGPTGSTELTLTETLPGAVTLVSWWGREAGWSEFSYTGNVLTLEYPSVPGGNCREVYVKVHLDSDAQLADELINAVESFMLKMMIQNGRIMNPGCITKLDHPSRTSQSILAGIGAC